ncbi:MAG: flagellar basal body P-ring protein FlgI, partial [Gemmataceae bacterium]
MTALFSRSVWLLTACLFGLCGCLHTETRLQSDDDKERDKDYADIRTIGDVTSVANATPIHVSGVGIVFGLEGTGSNPTADGYRSFLEDYLRKRGVDNVKEMLASPDTSLVLVSALIPPGARKDDPIDVEVTLPPHSKTTSLKGGYLKECILYNYDTTKHLSPDSKGGNRLVSGHPLAKAWGPLLVGFSGGDDKTRLQYGRIWGGGRCAIDRPVYLVLNREQKRAPVAIKVAERINETMQGGIGSQLNTLAEPKSDQLVVLKVAPQYRLNLPRYLRVVRMIPLQEGQALVNYRRRLTDDLLDPERTVVSALRLEAHGTGSVDVFKAGLEQEEALVRFCSAEALAYQGDPACGELLAKMVEEQPAQ